MPIKLSDQAPTLLLRKAAFEQAQLTRQAVDEFLNLTPDEFHVEGDVIAIGPVHDADALQEFMDQLEQRGLQYFDDYFEMPGNYPTWLTFFAMARKD